MATEVTVKLRDNDHGHAFFVRKAEWDLSLAEIRKLLVNQGVELQVEFRFLSGNGNVLSQTLEETVKFREVVEEPFTEIKTEDSSLDSAEQRVVPQVLLVPINIPTEGSSNNGHGHHDDAEISSCPFMRKFPKLACLAESMPCMRNVFNVHTLIKLAFLFTCLLFLLVFLLTMGLHLLFGLGALSGITSTGFAGFAPFTHPQAQTTFADQESLTSLKIKFSELEVTSRFEIQDLKRKLAELEDLYLRDIEVMRKQMAETEIRHSTLEQRYAQQMDGYSTTLDASKMKMQERWSPENQHVQGKDDVKVMADEQQGAFETLPEEAEIEDERADLKQDHIDGGGKDMKAKEKAKKSRKGEKSKKHEDSKSKDKKKEKKNKK